tara:strand:- start:3744 stop:4763 length:1020 start_codon:yes stop_codon:yes gene_type:complete
MAYETIANVPMMASDPQERMLYMQLQANAKKKAKLSAKLRDYRINPGKYGRDQRMWLEQQAMEAGLPMPDTETNMAKAVGKGLASAADTAMFGLLPNELYTPLNQAERVATGIGGLAGLAVPFGGPMKLMRGLGGAAFGAAGIKGAGKGFSGLLNAPSKSPAWNAFRQSFGWPFNVKGAGKVFSKKPGIGIAPEEAGIAWRWMSKDPNAMKSMNEFIRKQRQHGSKASNEKIIAHWFHKHSGIAGVKEIPKKNFIRGMEEFLKTQTIRPVRSVLQLGQGTPMGLAQGTPIPSIPSRVQFPGGLANPQTAAINAQGGMAQGGGGMGGLFQGVSQQMLPGF